jgi:hypothetical protein
MDYTIPEDWLEFCDVPNWTRGSDYYPYKSHRIVEIVPLSDIEPPQRDTDIAPFKKYKMCPVLFAFQSPECELPPVLVKPLTTNVSFRYRLVNGFHRFYASVHVGYTHIPVEVWPPVHSNV